MTFGKDIYNIFNKFKSVKINKKLTKQMERDIKIRKSRESGKSINTIKFIAERKAYTKESINESATKIYSMDPNVCYIVAKRNIGKCINKFINNNKKRLLLPGKFVEISE